MTEVAAANRHGGLYVYGPSAFPVIVGSSRWDSASGSRIPVVAAGRWHDGRVVVFGQDGGIWSYGYFKRATLEAADTGRLMTNALHWVAGDEGPARPRIGVVGANELFAWLTEAGHDAVRVRLTPESLGTVDVVILQMWNQSAPEIEALSTFVHTGGGLVTAASGVGWAYHHPDQRLEVDFAGNRLLAPVGIQWVYDWLDRTSPAGYAVDGPPHELTHAGTALDAVWAHANGGRMLTQSEAVQAIDSLIRASRSLPADDSILWPRLRTLVENAERDGLWPSNNRPARNYDVVARLAASLFVNEHNQTLVESVRAHPAAADFPGSVPVDAPRITRSVTIDTAVPRWHSTGLYAAPGELIRVKMPIQAATAGGYHIRIGAHSDGIWDRPEWKRMPEISRRFPVSTPETLVANAFGGLIYIEVPYDSRLGNISVEIAGAVEAPLFVLGETDLDEWRDTIRHAPAPWAEIAGRNMIVTTVSREVRKLDDPAAVAETWDRALDLSAELAAWPSTVRASPERFVVDRQIEAGYMHAGYPLMAHLDQKSRLVNAEHLRTCAYEWTQSTWGFYHEVGHNHQNYDWTFDGTVEVTVNLFTLYIYEFLCGIPLAENWRGTPEFRAELMAKYDFDTPDFERWKSDPFLALVMYQQLQQEFGWDAYRQVFAEYLALPETERPKSDDAKRDQWLVRFSRQVGRNLGPFFEAWGVPTSRAARNLIAYLPVWMPPDFPPGG